MKTRTFPNENYKAVYMNGKTMRFLHDNTQPMKELKYSEFYDVKITNKCNGKCPYCYQDSTPDNDSTQNMVDRIRNYFEPMSTNERPFQVAIGGGEPTLHPSFIEILKTVYDLGITPNYTTNGMHISPEIVVATKKYCGGVAITCHKHLNEHWRRAHTYFTDNGVKTNFHIVISDRKSVNEFFKIYKEFKGKVDYFVLLPYIVKGRAKPVKIEYKYLFHLLDFIKDETDISDIAFGAKFYEHEKKLKQLNVSLYEPEIMSKYLDFVEMKKYNSSFDDEPIGEIK